MNDLNNAGARTCLQSSRPISPLPRIVLYKKKKKKKSSFVTSVFKRENSENFGVFSRAFFRVMKNTKKLRRITFSEEWGGCGSERGKKAETMKRASVNFYARRFYFQVMCNPFNSSRIYGDTRDVRESDWITLLHH